MRLLVQRVKNASVEVNKEVVGKIDNGLLIFVGIKDTDTKQEADYLARKIVNLRIFNDENDKLNLSVKDTNGKLLIVSQFTLYANCEHGNRPSFIEAAKGEKANELYEYFCQKSSEYGIEIQKGIFGADMKVNLLNDGPVTIWLEKENKGANS